MTAGRKIESMSCRLHGLGQLDVQVDGVRVIALHLHHLCAAAQHAVELIDE